MHRFTLAAIAASFLAANAHAQSNCAADVTGDGRIDGVDLALVLTGWGVCQSNPTISGVYPPVGPAAGGTPIAIVGVDLGRTASVTIDGVIAPQFSVVSGTTVTAVTPAGSAGARAIVLRDAQGQEIAAANYNYFVSDLSWGTVIEQTPNPSVVTNAELRASIMATGLPWRVRDNGTGIEMLLVPPGTFSMGAGSDVTDPHWQELPVHSVTLTRAYYIARFETTQAQWLARAGSNPAWFQPPNVPTADLNRPVETISWDAINSFLAGSGLRLPTEAEWEFAYRAGTTSAFHGFAGHPAGTADEALVPQIAWIGSNSGGRTHPVGQMLANGFGLFDMGGNVWEYCQDFFAGYSPEPQTDPTGPSKPGGPVVRGGAYHDETLRARASMRGPVLPFEAYPHVGFRVARNP
jgi:formylglycine-generating enzyme required for sulfatase activity